MRFLLFSIKLGEGHQQIPGVNHIQNHGNLKLPLLEEGEVILEVREVDKMILVDRLVITLVQIIKVVVVEILVVGISQGTVAVMVGHLAIRVKTIVTLVEIKETGVEVEADLTPTQILEGLEWLARLQIKIKVDVSTVMSLDT